MSDQASEWPQTIDQAVDRMLDELSEEDKAAIAHMSASDLIDLHFSFGMSIRNAFGLWQGNHALLAFCSAGGSPIHPDDASAVIIEVLWKRQQGAG